MNTCSQHMCFCLLVYKRKRAIRNKRYVRVVSITIKTTLFLLSCSFGSNTKPNLHPNPTVVKRGKGGGGGRGPQTVQKSPRPASNCQQCEQPTAIATRWQQTLHQGRFAGVVTRACGLDATRSSQTMRRDKGGFHSITRSQQDLKEAILQINDVENQTVSLPFQNLIDERQRKKKTSRMVASLNSRLSTRRHVSFVFLATGNAGDAHSAPSSAGSIHPSFKISLNKSFVAFFYDQEESDMDACTWERHWISKELWTGANWGLRMEWEQKQTQNRSTHGQERL